MRERVFRAAVKAVIREAIKAALAVDQVETMAQAMVLEAATKADREVVTKVAPAATAVGATRVEIKAVIKVAVTVAAAEIAAVSAAIKVVALAATEAVAWEGSVAAKTHVRVRNPHRGVTLLELILALSLSVIVMGLISMAISINFRMYDLKRSNVEEAQLARSLLRHIADDIRATVQHMPPDLSGLDIVAGNSQLAGQVLGGSAMGALGNATGQGTGQGAGGQGANNQGSGGQNASQTGAQSGGGNNSQPGGGGNGTGGANPGGGVTNTMSGGSTFGVDPQTQQATSTYGEEQGTKIIGLYGSSTELQLDISRLPRVDQYQTQLSADGINQVVDIPSDMKTVSYYLGSEDGSTNVPSGGGLSGIDVRGRGLYRHTLDRAVAAYALENGNENGSIGKTDLLADEVIGLQFMYFDGAGWTEEWDSTSMEGLPVAIEITLILGDPEQPETATTSFNPFGSTSEEEESERYYTLTVNLPTALTADEKTQASQTEEETSLSQTGALDTSGDAAAAGATGGMGGMGGMGAGIGGMGGGQGGQGGQGGPGGPGGGRGDQDGGRGGQGPGGGGQGPGGGRGGPGGGFGGQGGFGGGQGGFGGGQGGTGGGRGGMGGGRGGMGGGTGGPGGGRGMGGGRGR